MKIEATEPLPKARRDGIITKEVDGELLVYDIAKDKAHCLNETAAAVWQLCDGQTNVGQISERLAVSRQTADGTWQKAVGSEQWAVGNRQKAEGSRQQVEGSDPTPDTRHPTPSTPDTRHPTPSTPDTRIVWLALDQLGRSDLLEESTGENEQTSWAAAIPGFANMSRREAVRRIGLGAAIALPVVMSMTAPTPVEAAVSCGAKCKTCSTPADCCGVCSSTSVPGCPTSTPRCT